MSTNPVLTTDSSIKLSAKEMLFKYLVYLPLFIVCLAIALSVAYTYLKYQLPIYNSTVSLLIKDTKGNRGGANEEMGLEDVMLYKKTPSLANEMEILKTTTMMARVVRAIGLNTTYFIEGNVKVSEAFPTSPLRVTQLSIADSNASVVMKFTPKDAIITCGGKRYNYKDGMVVSTQAGQFAVLANRDGMHQEYAYSASFSPVHNVASGLASSLAVGLLSKDASIIRININTENPEKGRTILNQLVREYNKVNVEDKNKVVDNTIHFIDERIDLLNNELGGVEHGLEDYRQKYNVIDIDLQKTSNFSDYSRLNNSISEIEIKLQVIDMVSSYVSNPSKRYQLVPSSMGIEDPTLVSLIAEYNRLQLSREEQLKTIPAENPIIKVQESQIEKLRTNIIENLVNIRRSTSSLKNAYQGEFSTMQSSLRTIPRRQRELLEIERQQGIKEKLYLFLRQKREESAITRASAVANSYSLDPATSSGSPVSPNRSGTYRLGLIIGLLVPIAFIYGKDLLNDKITIRGDVSKATSTPIIGEVGHDRLSVRKLVVGHKDRSMLSEQFRIIRTNLQFFIKTKQSPILLVTSTVAGEGKTFCSMNIAAVWAVAGKKTVIVELDLRKPKITKALELGNVKGITNLIMGQVTIDQIIVPLKGIENLDLVPAGAIPPNPAELLLDSGMDRMFEYLKQHYDFIIIDTAPVGLVSDAKILGKYADVTVYVLRQRYTFKKQLGFVDELHKEQALPNMSLLVNDIKVKGANSYYGYGYGYGYGYNTQYGYNYMYGNEQKSTVWTKIKDWVQFW